MTDYTDRIESEPIRDLIAMSADGDEWGHVMGHWFALVEVAYCRADEPIPDEFEFRPGAGLGSDSDVEDWPDAEYAAMLAAGEIDGPDMIQAAQCSAARPTDSRQKARATSPASPFFFESC